MPVSFFGQNIVTGRQDQGSVVSNVIEQDPAEDGGYLSPDSSEFFVSPDGTEYYQQPA